MPGPERALVEGRLRRVGNALLVGGDDLDGVAGQLDRRARLAVVAGQGGGLPGLRNPLLSFPGGSPFAKWLKDHQVKGRGPTTAFRDGKILWHNPGKLGANKPSKWDTFSTKEGTAYKNLRGYSKAELRKFRENPESSAYGGGIWFKKEGSAAVKTWGHGRNSVAIGEVSAEGKAGLKFEKDRGSAAVEGGVAANLVRGSVGFKKKYGEAEAGGSIGANAKGGASVGYDFKKKEVGARFGGSAFAGGEVHAGGGVRAGNYGGAKAQVGASYGIGATADADVKLGSKIKVKAKLGATLGLGVNVGVDVELDAGKAAKGAVHAGGKAVDAVGGVIDDIF
jgi:hypothetical protein